MRPAVVLMGILISLAAGPTRGADEIQPEVFQAFEIFAQVQELVKENYLEPVDPKILVRGALDGMILAVDRYGCYLDRGESLELPSTLSEASAALDLGIQGGHITAIRVQPGGAAEVGGLNRGDRIYLIGEQPAYRLTLREVDRRLSGRAGETVAITVGRPQEQRTLELTLNLTPRPPAPLPMLEEAAPGISILRMGNRLDERTGLLLQTALTRPEGDALVIDLRQCSVGEASHGIEAAQRLAPPDQVVALARGREGQPDRIWHGRSGREKPPRITALVGPSTAAGAEILAAAIQRLPGGQLVGKPTFGQAFLQESIPLEEGGTLRVTVAHFLTDQEERITGKGLTPDETVEGSTEGEPELDHALRLLAEGQPAPA